MKIFFVLAVFVLCGEANANYECEITIFSKGKKPETSKLELKPDAKYKDVFSAEQSGYIFKISRNIKEPTTIGRIELIEKASTRKSMAFGDWRTDNPDRPFGTILVEGEEGGERGGARMSCKTMP